MKCRGQGGVPLFHLRLISAASKSVISAIMGRNFPPSARIGLGIRIFCSCPWAGRIPSARAAVRLIEAIAPKVVIPMHYSIPGCSLDIAPLADFENAFGKDRIVGPVAALDSKDVDKYIGKAVVPEVLRHG